MRILTLALVASLIQATPPAKPDTYAALWLYDGSWQVTSKNQPPGAKPDLLINKCALLGIYFACGQTVNSSPGGLVVFIPAGQPGRFHTQTIMPEGRATGRDDLAISGDQWTYTSRRDEGGKTTFYRTTNTFTGKNRIHFEQAQSNNAKDWTIQNSGDEVRTRAGQK